MTSKILTIFTITLACLFLNSPVNAQLNLDTTFNAGVTDADSSVLVSQPVADGKIMVGGSFRIVNGTELTGLARLNSDGSLDTTFNPGGSGPNSLVYAIVELPDGKFLIGGTFSTYNGIAKSGIVRINADGSLDTTFNSGGAGVSGVVQTITLQSDGKIFISGSGLSAYNGVTRFSVIRLNADGTLDTTFTSPFANSQFVEEVDVQTDGKILIGGGFGFGSPVRQGVARLNNDGSVDATFNPAGGGTEGGGVYAMTIQADGKILIGGGFHTYNGVSRPRIARLNTDGSLDTAFNPNIGIGINGGEYFLIQPDGKILVAGGFGSTGVNYGLIRLNTDGSLDNTFTLLQTNSTGYHVSRQTDGKIFLSGFFTAVNGQTRRGLVRVNADGTLDPNFNASFTTFGSIQAMAQQADGKVIAAGTFGLANGISRQNIARFNTDGTLDTSFMVGTGTSPDPNNAANLVYDVAIQPDGKVIVAGVIGGYNGTARRTMFRLNSNGSLDNSFNATYFENLNVSFAYDILVQPDGKILVGGYFDGGTPQFAVRLNSDGGLDSGFQTVMNNVVRSFAYQPDGKIIIGGTFSSVDNVSRNRIARLNNNGSLDTSFDPGTGLNTGTVFTFLPEPDGKWMIGGTFTTYNGVGRNRIARINANGSLDNTFDPGSGANSPVYSIVRQTDGKFIIGGAFSSFNGTNINRLARLNADGSFDSSFASGFDNDSRFFARALLMQTGDKLVVGGIFKNYAGYLRNSLARINSSPAAPIANGKILFVSNRDGNQEIYTMNPDGTNQQRLTNSPENENIAKWSPDGTKILYRKIVSSTQTQIWTMNANGSNQILISDATGVHNIHEWSPDGQKILFAKRISSTVEDLWTMNADGTNKVQITNAGSLDFNPRWSPEGNRIVFTRCASGDCAVFKMNADGTNQVNLTPGTPSFEEGVPLWSRDGSKIVYFAQTAAAPNAFNVFTMNADGNNKQQITFVTSPQSYDVREVSPDGNKIGLRYSGDFDSSTVEVATINLDGSNLVHLTNNSVLDGFDLWSPDSAKIAFRSLRDGPTTEIYTMNADGTNVVRLTNNSATDYATDWLREITPRRVPFDFDGDGRTDVGIFRPAPGEWWINYSASNQTFAVQFGSSTDRIAAGDYTGDGKADIAFFRPSDSFWYVLRSEDNSFYAFPFGSAGDVHVPADYDGDGKTDAAVFRESNLTWYIQKSSGGLDFIGFGSPGDKPVVADYDGDGKADIAITRINGANREWWIRRSSDEQVFAVSFGEANDKAVQGDYTGDGKSDIALWRPSTGFWYILRSEDLSFYAFPFGLNGDTPTPGDYDGDGKFDAAVFRSSNSVWYQQRTTEGFTAITFGVNGDIPIPSAYVP